MKCEVCIFALSKFIKRARLNPEWAGFGPLALCLTSLH